MTKFSITIWKKRYYGLDNLDSSYSKVTIANKIVSH